METQMESLSVESLVAYREQDFMKANPEYQRGEVWTLDQQKKLIDSIFRGYQLPIIYLHDIRREVFGKVQERLEIIDGQQRINALYRYCKGEFPLYEVHDEGARFPAFLKNTDQHPCPWGGRDFDNLPEELKNKLRKKELPVAFIREADENEVRDLFVRLQAGFPLNAQEKRDSFPGEFTEFILKLGGKPALVGYPGHPLFTGLLGLKPGTDRGRTRQLAAQIAILFLERRRTGSGHFTDIKRSEIDDYYYTQLDFDSASPECQRLRSILDKLCQLLSAWKGPKLLGHNAIHLVMLLDSLLDDYTRSWEGAFLNAQEEFSRLHTDAAYKNKNGGLIGIWQEAWQEYGVWTRANSDSAESIERRHRFYSRKMLAFLGDDLVPKDSQRAFNDLERRVIYWRDAGVCQFCNSTFKVDWPNCDIHHVVPHKDGGRTILGNGVLVHPECHPKSDAAVREFAKGLKDAEHPGAKLVSAEPEQPN